MDNTFIVALERIIGATFGELPEIAASVDDRTRARLAIFCFMREHLRAKGVVIASKCRSSDLTAESSTYVAQSLEAHASEIILPVQRRSAVSLAAV